MFAKNPKHRRREIALLCIFTALILLGAVFHKDLSRRHLAWKISRGVGGLNRVFEAARRGPPMIPYLEAYLEDDDPVKRHWAMLALKAMQHPACLPTFVRMARSERGDVRLNGLDGLGEMATLTIYPVLVEGLRDPKPEIRRKCSTILTELTGETHMYDPEAGEEVRAAAAEKWEAWLRDREAARMGARQQKRDDEKPDDDREPPG